MCYEVVYFVLEILWSPEEFGVSDVAWILLAPLVDAFRLWDERYVVVPARYHHSIIRPSGLRLRLELLCNDFPLVAIVHSFSFNADNLCFKLD